MIAACYTAAKSRGQTGKDTRGMFRGGRIYPESPQVSLVVLFLVLLNFLTETHFLGFQYDLIRDEAECFTPDTGFNVSHIMLSFPPFICFSVRACVMLTSQ